MMRRVRLPMADPLPPAPGRLSDADAALAGEVALRMLEPGAMASAQQRMAQDAAFAAEVAAWEARLAPLATGANMAPSPDLWPRISAATGDAAAEVPAPSPTPPPTPAPTAANDNRLIWWKAASGAGFALSAALALMLVTRPAGLPDTPDAGARITPPMVAALASETGRMAMTATFDASTRTLVMTPVGVDTGTLFPELWLIPAQGPRKGEAISLGMVDAKKPTVIIVQPEFQAMIGVGATFAITPEPPGGAPGGKATGPIILKGDMADITA